MSTPDDAVRAALAEQAQLVTGSQTAGTPGAPDGVAAEADSAALLARIEQLEAARAAEAEARKPAPPDPPDITPSVPNGSGELQSALAGLHHRLLHVEAQLGIDAARVLAELV
jgi:hypothetical protein